MPGRDLSQPAKVTMASKRSACIIVSTESAITSRLTRDARIPSPPIDIPSETAMVTNSIGKPPAWRTPSFACLARRSRDMLQGVTSFHDDATATCGLSQSSSVMPIARSIARAGARSNPSVTSRLRGFMSAIRITIGRARRRRRLALRSAAAAGAEQGRRLPQVGAAASCLFDQADEEPGELVLARREALPFDGMGGDHLVHHFFQRTGVQRLEPELGGDFLRVAPPPHQLLEHRPRLSDGQLPACLQGDQAGERP